MRGIEDTSVLGVGLQSGVGQLGVGYLGVRGESLDTDRLSLDLQFAADKTLTARKGPTPVFTRGSSATQVGASGLIEYAPENLALQSENFGTTWVNNTGNALTLNDALSPTETLTADRIDFPATAAAGLIKQIQQSFSGAVAGNGPVTASVWLRTVSGASTVYLTLLDGGAPWQRVHVACNVTTAWTRFSVTLNTPTLSLFMTIGPDTRTTNGTPAQPAVQDAASVYAWGAQLERSSTARTYIPTTTAAVYGARFDHDPVTLACKGLLIEESRTNLTIRSDDFGAAEWNSAGARNLTVTTNNTTSPSGAADADLLTVGATTTVYKVVQALPAVVNVTSGTAYTISVFLKPNQVTRASVWVGNIVTLPADAIFDLTGSGSVVLTTAGTASIQKYPDGWYRCIITGTAGAASNTTLRIGPASGVSRTYIGNSVDSFWAWGAQVEAGVFPTSHIPTTTAPVVRSVDVCNITSISSFYTGVGTILVGSQLNGAAVLNGLCGFFTGANQISINRLANNTRAATNGASPTVTINSGTLASTLFVKSAFAFAFNTNDAAFANNGVSAGTSTSLAIPSVSAFGIGTNGTQTVQSGTISEIKVFKKRLPNAKLLTITT